MIGTRQQRIIRAAQDLIQQTYEFPDTLTIRGTIRPDEAPAHRF